MKSKFTHPIYDFKSLMKVYLKSVVVESTYIDFLIILNKFSYSLGTNFTSFAMNYSYGMWLMIKIGQDLGET